MTTLSEGGLAQTTHALTAMTAERAGYVTAQVLILTLLLPGGALLLGFGIRALLRSGRERGAWPAPTDEWLAPPGYQPAPPARRRGLVRVVVGPVLLLIGLLLVLGTAVDHGAREARSFTDVRLPEHVLGLARDDGPIAHYKADVRRTVGKGDFDQIDAGLYGTYTRGYLVVVNRSRYPEPDASAAAFLADQERETPFTVGEHRSITPRLSGAVRCEDATYPQGFHVQICVLVTKGSFVAVFDRHDATLADASAASLAIQEDVVTVR